MSARATRDAFASLARGARPVLALRWVRWLLVLGAFLVLLRLVLGLLLAFAIDSALGSGGLKCSWEDLDLSVFSGRGEAHGLALVARDGKEPFAAVDYAVFDVEVLPLFAGKLRMQRIEVDGGNVLLERGPDAVWNVTRYFASGTKKEAEAKPEEESTAISLSPSAPIGAIRLQDVYARVVDRTFEPALDQTYHVDAGVTDMWSATRKTRFSITVTGDKVLDGAHVDGEGDWNPGRIAMDVRAQVGGFRPGEIEGWLRAMGLRSACSSIRGHLAGRADVEVKGEARDSVNASFALSDVHVWADTEESIALDRANAEIESWSSRGASVQRIEIVGPRARASLEKSGATRVAGLDFLPAPPSEVGSSPTDATGGLLDLWLGRGLSPWLALLARDDPAAIPWSMSSFALKNGEIRLADRRVDPAAEFPVLVDVIDVRDVVHDRRRAAGERRPISLHVAARVPGTAESIAIDGSVAPFVPDRSVDVAVAVDGLGLEAMQGYLRAAGLEDARQRAGLRLKLAGAATTDASGATEGHLEVDETLTLDGAEASQLGKLRAKGLRIDPAKRLLRFGDVEVSGSRILLERDPSRRLAAFGMRTLGIREAAASAPPVRAPAAKTANAPKAALATSAALPRIELGRFSWKDNKLSLLDASQDPPVRIAVEPMSFELTGLVVGGESGAPNPPPAHLVARAAAPGLVGDVTIEGTIASRLGGVDLTADLACSATGLRGQLLAPYLRDLGIEPLMDDGRARMHAVARIERREGWRGSAKLDGLEVADGDAKFFGVDEIRVDDVASAAGGISIGRVSIVEPFARVVRPSSSEIRAGGLRYLPRAPAPESTPQAAPSKPVALAWPELPAIRLGEFELRDAKLLFADSSLDPPLETELRVEAAAKNLSTTGERGEFSIRAIVPGTIELLDVRGGVSIGATGAKTEFAMNANGVRSGPAARLLPPGTTLEAKGGSFTVGCTAEVAAAEAGGVRAHLEVQHLAWVDPGAEPWITLGRAAVDVPRIDPAAGVLEIGPASIESLALDLDRGSDGALHTLGLRLEDVPRAPEARIETPASEPRPPVFSRIRLSGDLLFTLARFRYRDATLGEKARPVEASFEFRVPGGIDVLGGEPRDLPPIAWSLDASVRGLVERCRIEGALRPMADAPQLEAKLTGSGVRTQGLVEMVPALAPRIAGDVEAGTLEGRLDVQLAVQRAKRTESGFDRPFRAEVRVEGLAFRDKPGGEVLVGVDSIAADVAKVDRRRRIVHVKSLEIVRPRGLAKRVGNSLSVCGLAIDLGTGATEEQPAPAAPTAARGAIASEPAGTGELRIDRLLVSGVAAELRDTTRDPPVVVPLAGLDVEAGPLTTRALREPIPLRFHAVVAGAPPSRAVSGGSKAPPMFDELTLSGQLVMQPAPKGWVQVSLTGLELPEVVALAPPQAVGVREGTLDARVRTKLKGRDPAHVDLSLVFTDLDVTEPAGGPIEKSLALPVALDAALFLLRNPAGEHRFSVGFDVEPEGIGRGQIALAAASATAQVIGVAIAGAPLRLLTAFAPSGKAERGPIEVREIAFAPGATDLPPDADDVLRGMLQTFETNSSLALVVRHEFGAGDAKLAEGRANPPTAECLALVERARQRKAELLRSRAEAATRARALLAVGAREAAAASDALRTIDVELVGVEQTLDGVLAIIDAPSNRQVAKRTRVAALEVGQARLDAIAERIQRSLEKEALDRLDLRAPRFEIAAGEGGGRIVLELHKR